ncbi:MAG: flagellar hook-associated protein FlgK [Pseudomonadota bacterium]
MSISSAPNNAVSGLTANARLASVTAGNLANALTPGYGRQAVDLSAATVGETGAGVRAAPPTRTLDPDLTAARRTADADLAEQSLVFDALGRLERSLGTIDDASSLVNRIGNAESTLRQMAETPEVPARQQAAAQAASDLAERFNLISTETVRLRETTDSEINRRVEQVNDALGRIANLNRQIQVLSATGRSTANLIDERERLIDTVAQNVPIRVSPGRNDTVEIRTLEGLTLANTSATQIEFTRTPTFEPGLGYAANTPIPGGLILQGLDVTPGGPGAQQIRTGALAGLFEVRDRIAPELERRLDSLAADAITRLADPAVDPTLAPGDAGLFTDRGSAFDPADSVGIAGRIALNAAVDPRAGGDPARLRDGLQATQPRASADASIPQALRDAFARLGDASTAPATPGVSGQYSLQGRTIAVIELLATERVGAEAQVSALSATREALATEESDTLGVDQDAELQRLIEIEQAYAANAQVIQTAARMLDELTRIR